MCWEESGWVGNSQDGFGPAKGEGTDSFAPCSSRATGSGALPHAPTHLLVIPKPRRRSEPVRGVAQSVGFAQKCGLKGVCCILHLKDLGLALPIPAGAAQGSSSPSLPPSWLRWEGAWRNLGWQKVSLAKAGKRDLL